jgi:hypothetical protein
MEQQQPARMLSGRCRPVRLVAAAGAGNRHRRTLADRMGHGQYDLSGNPPGLPDPRRARGKRLVKCSVRHARHGLRDLHGPRPDGSVCPWHFAFTGDGRTRRHLSAGGPFSGGSQVAASLAPSTELAMARLCEAVANMAVTDERSPLAEQRIEDLEFWDGMIRSQTGNVGESLAEVLARG